MHEGTLRCALVLGATWLATACALTAASAGPLPEPRVLDDDGGWCWFQDPRALVLADELVLGSVASGWRDPQRRGDVQLTRCALDSRRLERVVLHPGLELDDHDAPALRARADGGLLAVYARHGGDRLVRWRLLPHAGAAWEPERRLEVVGENGVCYSNLLATGERLLDFHRGEGWDPCWLVSDDQGSSWRPGGRLLSGPGRPYARYAGDGRVVHVVVSEQHPRDFDNGLYHGVLDGTRLLGSDGRALGAAGELAPEQLTRLFAGRPDAVAWPVDLELDAAGRPRVLFSVQVDGAGLPRGRGGLDHRFHLARWDGTRWQERELAFAGTRLYAGEDDYTGLGALDPDRDDVLWISTDADPQSGAPLVSAADGRRHRELFQGRTQDGGEHWTWRALTRDSSADQLRPLVPARRDGRTALCWLRGTYRSYTDYELEVLGLLLDERGEPRDWPRGESAGGTP